MKKVVSPGFFILRFPHFATKVLKSLFGLIPLNFVTLDLHSWEWSLKITRIELKLLANVNMILDYEHSIRGWVTGAICHHVKANNKYMHDYDKSKEYSYIQYFEFNKQYGWALSEPLLYGELANVEDMLMFIADFTKNHDKNNDLGYTLITNVDCPVYSQPLYRDLPFLAWKNSNQLRDQMSMHFLQ